MRRHAPAIGYLWDKDILIAMISPEILGMQIDTAIFNYKHIAAANPGKHESWNSANCTAQAAALIQPVTRCTTSRLYALCAWLVQSRLDDVADAMKRFLSLHKVVQKLIKNFPY
jgi:hypothetical protein